MTENTNALPSEKLAFTIKEWGAYTGEARTRTYEAMASGQLKARKLGRRTIILRDDGLAYLNSLPGYEPKKAA